MNLPTPGKNLAGAHVYTTQLSREKTYKIIIILEFVKQIEYRIKRDCIKTI